VPSALLLTLGGDIPGLVAITPASAAAAKSTHAVTNLGNLGEVVSLGFGINASGEVVGRSYLDTVFFFTCGKHTRLIHAGGSGRLRGARDCSHHPAERTDTGGGPP